MKTSKVFKIAKERLANKEHSYICYALHAALADGAITRRDHDRNVRIIEKLLGEDNHTLGRWLIAHKKIVWWQHHRGTQKIHETRLAWLDHLIAHYEAKGD